MGILDMMGGQADPAPQSPEVTLTPQISDAPKFVLHHYGGVALSVHCIHYDAETGAPFLDNVATYAWDLTYQPSKEACAGEKYGGVPPHAHKVFSMMVFGGRVDLYPNGTTTNDIKRLSAEGRVVTVGSHRRTQSGFVHLDKYTGTVLAKHLAFVYGMGPRAVGTWRQFSHTEKAVRAAGGVELGVSYLDAQPFHHGGIATLGARDVIKLAEQVLFDAGNEWRVT